MSELAATATPSQPLSEYRIAKIAGVSYSHVNRVLRKGHHPRFDTAVKIAVAAGMSLDELAAVVYRDNGELRAAVAEIGKRRGRVPTADDQAAIRRKTVNKARAALAEKRRKARGE